MTYCPIMCEGPKGMPSDTTFHLRYVSIYISIITKKKKHYKLLP